MPARVLGTCIDASAPGEEALAFNTVEEASSPDPLAAVRTEAAKGAGSEPDPTPPAKVSEGSVGLPKTLTLADLRALRPRQVGGVQEAHLGGTTLGPF